ncbi:MAG: cyclase family protein [Alicyclobacillus herbarius]|uniref:cyclase family protein n=1 Tax=Alicyclobacillus herbarius TaxID=122960 RepID=UPI000553F474|nr:cyclase family protein [Alicyclobacillus herbarius]MCL6632686.1 cyclase family protein [Alicyclobacillus herbarius]
MPIRRGMPVYKNKPEKQPEFETTSDFQTGSAHETRLHLDAHTGTHIDAPLHMVEGGATIESIPIADLVRPCRVVDLTHVNQAIRAGDLAKCDIQPGEFLLFKTQNSFDDEFNFEFVYVAADAAQVLADKGVAGVGIDGLGIERAQPNHETHKTLLEKGIHILEGLRLADVAPGRYLMVAAPLRLEGIDAAPARVVLLEDAS